MMEPNDLTMELFGVLESLGYEVPLCEAKISYEDCEYIANHFWKIGKNDGSNV